MFLTVLCSALACCGSPQKIDEIDSKYPLGAQLRVLAADVESQKYRRLVLEEMLVIWANARSHGAPYNYYLRPEPKAN